MITEEQKGIIEGGLIAVTTTDHFCGPNVIILNGAKVISDTQILVTDIGTDKTKVNLEEDPRAAIAAWLPDGSLAYQFKGEVEYKESNLILNVTQIWNINNGELISGEEDDQ